MTQEQKDKMQAARKAKAEQSDGVKSGLPVLKLSKSDAPEYVKLFKVRISRSTVIANLQANVNAILANAGTAAGTPVRVGGTLVIYGTK